MSDQLRDPHEGAPAVETSPLVTEQMWRPEQREDGVYLIGTDGTTILKMCRPDRGSDLFMAGYIAGLQALGSKRRSDLTKQLLALRQAELVERDGDQPVADMSTKETP